MFDFTIPVVGRNRHMNRKITNDVENFFHSYCDAIDYRRWDEFDDIFTNEADLYYNNRLFGFLIGKKGKKREVMSWLKNVFGKHGFTSHMVSNVSIDTKGINLNDIKTVNGIELVATAKVANYQCIGPITYFSSGTYRHTLIYKGNQLKSKKLYETAGVFYPVLSFSNCIVLLALWLGIKSVTYLT